MKLTAPLLTLCCCIALLAACQKKEDENDNNNNNNTPTAKAAMLIAGKWQTIAYTATVNYMGKDTSIDLFKDEDECDKDDFMLFLTNGICSVDENTNKCPDDGQIYNFPWALLNDDTKLALVDANPDTFDLTEITPTQFTIKKIRPNSSGTPVTHSFSYKNIK